MDMQMIEKIRLVIAVLAALLATGTLLGLVLFVLSLREIKWVWIRLFRRAK